MRWQVLLIGILVALAGAALSGFLPIGVQLNLGNIAGIPVNMLVLAVGALITIIGIVLPSM